jgi:tetratricopeptide (TPR) repeat protein
MTQKKNWFARLRDFIASFRARDVNTINVGKIESGAQDINIAAGRFIFQSNLKIGTLVVPAVPVLIGVIVFVSALALGAYVYFIPDKMPDGGFNVAVAEFTELDANQQLVVSDNARLFSEYAFDGLQKELTQLNASFVGALKPVVWHDKMFPWQIRAQIGFVPSIAPTKRETDARDIATRLGAKIVVYGNVDKSQTPAHFVPEVYVAPVTTALDDMFGRYQFGAPITIQKGDATGSKWAEGLSQRRALDLRQQALAQFTLGLLHDFDGLHGEALKFFERALKILLDAGNREGIESVYFFIGRQHLFLANQQYEQAEIFFERAARATDPSEAAALRAQAQPLANQVEPILARAEDAFRNARDINANFARAYSGLAGVARVRVLLQAPRARIEQPDQLNRAFADYRRALQLAEQANETNTATRVTLSLGTTFFLQGEGFLFRDEWESAIGAFDQTLALTEPQLPKLDKQYRSLAEGYLTLGNAYFGKGYARLRLNDIAAQQEMFRRARAYYQKCIALKGIEPSLDQGAVARCERYKANVE